MELDVIDLIASEYLRGASITSLARKYRRGWQGVRTVLIEASVELRTGSGRFTKAQEREVVTQYVAGVSANTLRKRLGCTGSAIHNLLRRHGVVLRTKPAATSLAMRGSSRPQIHDRQIVAIESLYLNGKTTGQIAKAMGVSQFTVYLRLKKAGLLRLPIVKVTAAIVEESIEQCSSKRGKTVAAFARERGVDPSALAKKRHERGVRLGKGGYFALDLETERQICSEYREGITRRALADKHGLSLMSLRRMLRRQGITGTGLNQPGNPRVKLHRYRDRNGRDFLFRSSYEKAFAQYLDRMNAQWQYEQIHFKLSDGRTYTPDVWVESWGHLVEVKGFMRPRSAEKIRMFRSEYPDYPLVLANQRTLKQQYGIRFSTKNGAAIVQ